jgi:hypothetical protein
MGAPNSAETGVPHRADTIRRDSRLKLPWPKDREFRILALDGGGIRGAFQGAFLARLEKECTTGRSISEYFDLIVGTSTGGLITCGFAVGRTATEISQLYVDQGRKIFPPRRFRLRRWLLSSRDSHQLEKLIKEIVGDNLIFESKIRFCIPSCEAKNREIYIWKTPHHPDYILDWKDPIAAAATATTAAPTFFREFSFGHFEHLDGGVYANNPALIGVAEALSAFDVAPQQVKILSIGSGDFGGPTLTDFKKRFGGLAAWHDIHEWFIHFQSIHVVGMVGLLIGPQNQIRVDPLLPGTSIALDDYDRTVEELLPSVGPTFEKHEATIRSLFLRQPVERYSPIYTDKTPPGRNA